MLRRLLVVLAAAAAASGQGPSPTEPALLPGDLDLVPAASDQWIGDIAPGDGQLLAVWQDERADLVSNLLPDQSGKDVWAARFDGAGQLLDLLPFPVTQGAGDQRDPRAAWNGSAWLVAWTAQVPTEFYYTDGIEVARVAPDGTVLDPTPMRITTASNTGNMELWDVASDGDGWAVVWKDWAGANWQVRGARVGADGTLIDATPQDLGATSSQPYRGDVVFAGGQYVVVWKEWAGTTKDDIRARRLAPTLAPMAPIFTIASHGYYEVDPRIATDGTDFFVVWERYDTCCVGGGGKVFGSRVLQDGTVLDGPTGLPIYAPPLLYGTTGREPAVAWDGTNWVATFTKPVDGALRVDAARVTPAGVTLDPDGFDLDGASPRQEASRVVGLPAGGSLVLWTDSRAEGSQPYDTYGALLSTAGLPTPLGARVLAAPAQGRAVLVGVPGGALAVWTSRASGERRVLAQRLDATGAALQPEPVELASGPDVGNARAAWSGSVVLATWNDAAGVHARRLDASGTPLGAPIDVMPGYVSDVAALDGVFLVTALDTPTNPEIQSVFARRVTEAGAVLDGSSVAVGWSFARSHAVAPFDGGFLVAWQRNFTHDDPNSALHLRFVSVDNVPGTEVVVSNGITDGGHNELPTLAVDDTGQALLAWQVRLGGGNWDIVARRVLPGPTLLDPARILVTTAPNEQLQPEAAWDGEGYVVAWQDRRAASLFWDGRTDVYAARVTVDGDVLDPAGLALADSALPETWPAVAGLGGGSALFGWSAFHDEEPYTAYRIETSVLDAGVGPWLDLGGALAGTRGMPLLVGEGALGGGDALSLTLANALENTTTTLVVGLEAITAPFKGGTLVPAPTFLVAGIPTGPAGNVTLDSTWPSGAPSGFVFVSQHWIVDPAGPKGLAASNGLSGTTP